MKKEKEKVGKGYVLQWKARDKPLYIMDTEGQSLEAYANDIADLFFVYDSVVIWRRLSKTETRPLTLREAAKVWKFFIYNVNEDGHPLWWRVTKDEGFEIGPKRDTEHYGIENYCFDRLYLTKKQLEDKYAEDVTLFEQILPFFTQDPSALYQVFTNEYGDVWIAKVNNDGSVTLTGNDVDWEEVTVEKLEEITWVLNENEIAWLQTLFKIAEFYGRKKREEKLKADEKETQT
jgi:hypothetical protein